MEFLTTFDNLKHGDKIISPIDNEVTQFLITNDGEKYLANRTCMYYYTQFNPSDFCLYYGNKNIGEKDYSYFTQPLQEEIATIMVDYDKPKCIVTECGVQLYIRKNASDFENSLCPRCGKIIKIKPKDFFEKYLSRKD